MASTYVNNLRLNEMATGDGTGTWGTTTNKNLELIADAFGYGTRAIADASTDIITMGDGVSDADRSMYLKLTGGGQACTVSLLPATSSKVWIMENATSYTLTFTCGTGANVAIFAGEIKMIATDGGGGDGIVYDVLTDVNLAGTTKVDDLTVGDDLVVGGDIAVDGTANLDEVDIDGAVQIDSTVTVGVDDTGYDVKFFGATASAYMLWDESADDLILAGAAGLAVDGTTDLDNTDIDGTLVVDGSNISLDSTTTLNIDNSNTSNGITVGTATSGVPVSIGHTTSEVTVNDNLTVTGIVTAAGTSVFTNLDISGDVDVNGTLETDALSINGDSVNSTADELNILDGATVVVEEVNYLDLGSTAVGTAIASKAVVLDSNKDYTGIRNLTATTLIGALTGDASGNAATATALETARTIGGTSFNGTANIAVGLAATATALATARTIGGTSFDGTANIAVGLAATATALASARTIGGTSFDGTGNIVPATITVADTTDTSSYVGLFESATGSLEPKTDAAITYNAGTGVLTSTFAGNITGNVTGNASGSSGSTTGNAATATALATARTIGGTSFDGTANIAVALAAEATALATARTIGGTSFDGTANIAVALAAEATALETARTIGGTSFDGTANIAVGLATLATDATTLATPRAINGVNFDGSAAITVTAAAGTLSGGTLASGVTASSLTSVGTLTSVTTSGDITIDATDKIYLDGGSNTYITESAADTISFYVEGMEDFVFGGGGNPYIKLKALNTGVGSIQYWEEDSGGGGTSEFKWQASCRGSDNNYYISDQTSGIEGNFALKCHGASSRDVTVGGALAKGSGSFKIDHPLPSMKDTHSLVHSFMESPRADLQYRGSVTLANGTASVDLDAEVGMTDGTWELLCRDPQVFLQNESGWSALKGSVSGSTLIINCKDTTSFDTVSWMVVAERQDEHMMETSWTDDDGRPILEPLKPEDVEDGS